MLALASVGASGHQSSARSVLETCRIHEGLDVVCHLFGIFRVREHAPALVGEDLMGACVNGGYHRQATRHAFDYHKGTGVEVCWKQNKV